MIINSGGQNYAGENKRIKSDAGNSSNQIQDKVVDYNAKIQEQEEKIKNLEKQMKELKSQHDAEKVDVAFAALNSYIDIAMKSEEAEMERRLNGPSLPYPNPFTQKEALEADMWRRL